MRDHVLGRDTGLTLAASMDKIMVMEGDHDHIIERGPDSNPRGKGRE